MSRPNIILITTDQQRFDTIARLGNSEIYTPHLDWLTDGGTSFSNAYADCPICMPSRATIMTGKHGYNLGLTGNGTHYPVAEHQTLPQLLTESGYQTRAQGKMHFHSMRCHFGFEQMEISMDYYRWMAKNHPQYMPKSHGIGENETHPAISSVPDNLSLTSWVVDRSIDFLETRDETRPFFMWTSFSKPHPPYDPCENYWRLYENQDVSLPTYGDWSEYLNEMPQGFMQASYKLNATHRFSEPQLKQMKRAYYACITQVDYQLGRLFARLRELDLMENTWLIFTSDHGEMLGDHHMGAKSVYLEGSSHIPLIIRAPSKQIDGFDRSQTPNTETVSQLTTLADLMSTILDITGTPVPADMDGHSLLNLSSKKDPVYYGQTNKSLFAVMKDDLKYMYSVIGGDELCFDLTTDPMEQMNLMKRPEYSDRICELKKLMIGHIKQYAPEIIDDQDNIIKEAPIQSADEIHKWPGFHSITENSDLLH